MGKAKVALVNSRNPIPTRLKWLFAPFAYKYFTNQKVRYNGKNDSLPFSLLGNDADPMAYVTKVTYSLMLCRE